MIAESIMHGYFKLSSEREVRVDALFNLIITDAALLSFWVNTLNCAVEPLAIHKALGSIESRILRRIIQSHLLAMQSAPTQKSEQEWRHHLLLSFIAQRLYALRGPAFTGNANQARMLMALAGFEIRQDTALQELYEFRYVDPVRLVDANPVLCAYVCVSQNTVEESAQLAEMLFDIAEHQYTEICSKAEVDCEQVIQALNLTLPAPEHWQDLLTRAVRLGLLTETLSRHKELGELHLAYQRICSGLFKLVPECFVYDATDQTLQGINLSDIKISVANSPSMLARCARDMDEFSEEDEEQSCVVDRQIMRHISASRVWLMPLLDNGDLVGVLMFPDDLALTEQHILDRRSSASAFAVSLNNLSRERKHSANTLEKYRARHEQLLREIVHEVNNPLSIINNYLHILELRLEGESGAKDQLELISEEIRRTATIIRRVIDVPRLNEEEFASDLLGNNATFSLKDTITKVAELSRGYAKGMGIDIEINLPDPELFLHSDPDKLTQMLINLSKNAVEAMSDHKQGDQIVFELHDGVYRNGLQGVEIVVRDNGPGISDQVLGALYEPKEFTHGSGLGLHITFNILQTLGGAMDVRTSQQGTAFSMFLPRNPQNS